MNINKKWANKTNSRFQNQMCQRAKRKLAQFNCVRCDARNARVQSDNERGKRITTTKKKTTGKC